MIGPEPIQSIVIVAIPPGEAPVWVREKWIGLELPVARSSYPKKLFGFGVLSGPKSLLTQLWYVIRGRADTINGYTVDAASAINILAMSSPEAANWWRENAPQVIAAKRLFIFHQEVCQAVSVKAD